jgi:hypothetical protein
MMNNVHSLPMNLPMDFMDGINSVDKNGMSSFFLLCFNYYFSHCNSLGKYRENISVCKIRRQFTSKSIPSVFPFVFIDFLVVQLDINIRGNEYIFPMS